MSRFDDPDAPPPDNLVECPSCHAKIPEDRLKRIGGRMLCPGCASAFFDDEEEDD